MKVLIDTHIALWSATSDDRLSKRARELISAPDVEVAVSVVTLWEIAIKHALKPRGPNAMAVSAAEASRYFEDSGYGVLPIEEGHALAVESLKAIHADPFDRMIIAQALSEPMRLVTADKTVARYSDTIILV